MLISPSGAICEQRLYDDAARRWGTLCDAGRRCAALGVVTTGFAAGMFYTAASRRTACSSTLRALAEPGGGATGMKWSCRIPTKCSAFACVCGGSIRLVWTGFSFLNEHQVQLAMANLAQAINQSRNEASGALGEEPDPLDRPTRMLPSEWIRVLVLGLPWTPNRPLNASFLRMRERDFRWAEAEVGAGVRPAHSTARRGAGQ
ncbi:Protein of unknown function [Gryllus bimaculatus]|nr:Protein of unknown function [Gryllus bimaculatus]